MVNDRFQGEGDVWSGTERLGRVRYDIIQHESEQTARSTGRMEMISPGSGAIRGTMLVIEGNGPHRQRSPRLPPPPRDGRPRRFVIRAIRGRGLDQLDVEGLDAWSTLSG